MPKHMGRVHRRESLAAYLMLLPDVLGLIVFVVLPILFAIYVSLNSWSGLDWKIILPCVLTANSNIQSGSRWNMLSFMFRWLWLSR